MAKFLQTHPDFELLPITASFGRPALSMADIRRFDPDIKGDFPTEFARRIFPSDGGEGHFIALLKRRGDTLRREVSGKPAKGGKPDPMIAAAKTLWASCFNTAENGSFVRYGDTVRLLPEGIPQTNGIPLLSVGVAVGTAAKNRIEPHHALFASCHPADCYREAALTIDDPRAAAFVHGEEITVDCDDGYAVVSIQGIPCGFGKVSRGTLKNKYPKGLRTL